MKNFIVSHLKSNSGDGYVWFLVMTIAVLILFGSLFGLMQTAVSMRDVRQRVDDVAAEFGADVRENPFRYIAMGGTDSSYITMTKEDVAQAFADLLGGDIEPSIDEGTQIITVHNAKGDTLYTLKNPQVTYIDRLLDKEGNPSNLVGDVNDDRLMTAADLEAAKAFINGKSPLSAGGEAIVTADVDITNDGVVDEHDLEVLRWLIDFFSTQSGDSEISAMLVVSFTVTVPLRFAVMSYGEDEDVYSYPVQLNFKPA